MESAPSLSRPQEPRLRAVFVQPSGYPPSLGLLAPADSDQKSSIFDYLTNKSNKQDSSRESKMDVCSDKPKGRAAADSVTICHENTYQLSPKNTFQSSHAQKVAQVVVNRWIHKDTRYDKVWAKTTAKGVAGEIEIQMKQLEYDRYKFVVQVFIGQKNRQGVKCCSRFLSSADTDSFSEYRFENETLWCVVLVFALYFE
ncbi:unnamed protein product [Lymnaea stagnalis]|uniref:Uncharacterized protein n=1 Tax=Lymnaea stagnalis TaxID=6523 RepID=A0AAV2HG74_LYMST